jgi:hypothetical protein
MEIQLKYVEGPEAVNLPGQFLSTARVWLQYSYTEGKPYPKIGEYEKMAEILREKMH